MAAALAHGRVLCDLGRYDEAVEVLRRAVAEDLSDPVPLCELARALCGAARWDEAISAAESAIGLAPANEWPHRLHAIALLGAERKTEAEAAAREAVELEPDLAATWQILARCLMARRDRAKARDAAERALALDPEDASSHAILGDISLRSSLGQARLAERHLRAALAREPEDPALLNNLGVALRAQDREGESAQVFEAAARLDPRNEVSRENLRAGGLEGTDAKLAAGVLVLLAVVAIATGGLLVAAPVLLIGLAVVVVLRVQRRERLEALSPSARKAVEDSRRGPRRRRSRC